jgi:predicted RNase H-like nuclease (RuvC/YqgF family)
MTRHIESELKSAEIEYDIHIRHSDFGYASSRLVVSAPLPAIRGLIESKRSGDFNVIISPVRKRIEFLPLEPKSVPLDSKPKYFILGVDPGTTAAYCLLSLRGKVKSLRSKKGFTRADIIREVYEIGIPVMVASDVPSIPHFVEKIASTVNATTYTPNKPIPVANKQELAREYASEVKVRNAHERDALTAAVYAYKNVLPKLQQIDRMVREEELQIDRNHLKALVLKGTPINEALARLEPEGVEPPESFPEERTEPEEELTQERFDALKTKSDELALVNQQLEEKVEDLKRMIEFMKFRESELTHSLEIVNRANYWRVKRDREVAKAKTSLKKAEDESKMLQRKLDELNARLERFKGAKRLEMKGDMLPIKIIPHFSRESIEEYHRKVGLKSGDIVLFEDASGAGPQTANILIEREIRAVVVETALTHLSQEELVRALIPVIDAADVELQRIDEFAFISRKKFEKQMQTFTRNVREEARRRGEDDLVELVERYRHESGR